MLRLWMYDLAREQCPTPAFLDRLARLTLESGYDALGLYLEHAFSYPTVGNTGVIGPDDIARLRRDYPSLTIIPFINLLGHMEGFLYTEGRQGWAEERFKGLSANPTHPEFKQFCTRLVDDTLRAFDSELIHLGGDETMQLGQGGSRPRFESLEAQGDPDPKATIYAEHFLPFIEQVQHAGRRPGLWGDMLLTHPAAAEAIPRETLIFDWQYFDPFAPTVAQFRELGFEVVASPTLHLYNSTWMNLDQAERNVRDAASTEGIAGVCVTTWEAGLFGNYETLFSTLRWAGQLLNGEDLPLVDAVGEWGRILGVDLVDLGGPFAEGRIRSSLKVRLLLMANPFLAWMHHAADFRGPLGDQALYLADYAIQVSANPSERGVAVFLKRAVEFVRLVDRAHEAYANGKPGEANSALAPTRQIFEDLERVAQATHLNAGGSRADAERCRIAKRHVETVMSRITQYGGGSLGYLPAFETITHPRFCPYDQAAWWLINRWAHE